MFAKIFTNNKFAYKIFTNYSLETLQKTIFNNCKIFANEFPFTKSHELKQKLRSEAVVKKCFGKKLFLKFENVIKSHFISRFYQICCHLANLMNSFTFIFQHFVKIQIETFFQKSLSWLLW